MDEENKEKYKDFGKSLCPLQRLINSYHYAWLRENGEYVYLKKDILDEIKEIMKEEK